MSLRSKSSLWMAQLLVGAMLLLGASAGALAQHCAAPAARVVSIQGSTELRLKNAQQWQAAQSGAQLCSGDSVRTGPRSRAALLLPNETTLRLDQGTTLTLSAPDQAQASLLDLILGTIHVITRTPRPFRVNTPYLNAGVEGTEFLVGSNEASARLAVFEGKVSATSAEGSLMLVGGEIAFAAKGAPLRKERMLRPADAVQWALYYPTLFDYRLGEGIAGTPGEAVLRESIALYRQDRLAEAIFRLDKASEGQSNPRFLTYRAGLLLLVGQADEAGSDIERALAVDAGNSNAHALKSVVALTQNHKDQALRLATRAVELDPASPVAKIALSYAQQAHFKIEEALASVQRAVELDTQNALAWARLAELHMSTGYLDRALEAAKRAVDLNPNLGKTQSVLGFANLTRIDTQAAKEAFQKAIDLDQADPLPRLGLGLAMIREGELTAGREQLEIAVCLDPENSLLRSYVGKAYHEEKRDKLAGVQFDLAKESDPRDPTPWFYDAIRKQAENRPVEALLDYEQSIALNRNRAPYRSRLLLDEDQASRSAALARTYEELGFHELGLVEAAKALTADNRNYAAHLFLSDAFAASPRHQAAIASEQLQYRIWEPEITAPISAIQARDSYSSEFPRSGFLTAISPARASFNEFTPLFNRNRVGLFVDGVSAGADTLGSQVIATGNMGPVSFSLGHGFLSTDGPAQYLDSRQDGFLGIVKVRATSDTTLHAEFGRTDSKRGDFRNGGFDPDKSFPVRLDTDVTTHRVGVSHRLSARSSLVVLLSRKTRDEHQTFPTFEGSFQDFSTWSNLAEAQWSYADSAIAATVGASNLTSSLDSVANSDGSPPEQDPRRAKKLYAYWRLDSLNARLAILGGLSMDWREDPSLKQHRTSPKLGFFWMPASGTTLRGAILRTFKPTFLGDQTLEPTQIAGFNQFFDDPERSTATLYGLGIDHRVASNLHAGIETTRRHIQNPAAPLPFDFNWDERATKVYLASWIAPNPNRSIARELSIAFSVRFDAEKRMRPVENTINDGIVSLSTRLLPVRITLFPLSPLSLNLGATHIRQSGRLQVASDTQRFDIDERFWLVDSSLSLRFPRNRGVVLFGVNNVFDRKLGGFYESDLSNPRFSPRRLAFARVVLSF